MTQLLSYEEWKEKNIQINDGVVEHLKTLHNLSDNVIESEFENLFKQEYDLYVMEITSPDEYHKWKQEHYNEKLDCYDV
jgi:hypothetical protein